MDTRKYLDDSLAAHKMGKLISSLDFGLDDDDFWILVETKLPAQAKEGDLVACEWVWLYELQNLFEDQEDIDLNWFEEWDTLLRFSLKNGSKYAGLLLFLCAKHKKDNDLLTQYAEYSAIEAEFAYLNVPLSPSSSKQTIMDTKKYWNEALKAHENGQNASQLYLDDNEWYDLEEKLTDLARKGDPWACEWVWLLEINTFLRTTDDQWSIQGVLEGVEELDDQIKLSLRNGSKYAGFLLFLCAKQKKDQNLISKYSQYLSIEEEFNYSKHSSAKSDASVTSSDHYESVAQNSAKALEEKLFGDTQNSIKLSALSQDTAKVVYHLGLGKQNLGQFTVEQIKQKISSGQFDPQCKVWTKGMAGWKQAIEVPEIADLMDSSPPPLPDDGPPPL